MTYDRIPLHVSGAFPDLGTPRRSRKGRWIAISTAVVVVLCVGGYGFAAALNHLGATVQRYYRTVGSGDFAGACGMLTDSGRAKLISQERVATCEGAAEHWRGSLTPGQRDWLVHGHIWVDGFAAEGSRKEIALYGNPIGIDDWAIYKHEGHETISDWGPGAQTIPPSPE